MPKTKQTIIREAFNRASKELGKLDTHKVPLVVLQDAEVIKAATKGTNSYIKKALDWKAPKLTYFPAELVKLAATYAEFPSNTEIKKVTRREGKKILGHFHQSCWECPELNVRIVGIEIFVPAN